MSAPSVEGALERRSGGSRILCLGANEAGIFVWGAKGEPLTTRGSGKRRKFPSGVWDGAPETDAILNISSQMEYILGSC